jgi:hypothetical protein
LFATVNTIPAANSGSHAYNYIDDVSLIGCVKLYYRVRQTNADGGSYYSNIIPVNCNTGDADEYVLKVYPNPITTGSQATVSYSLPAGVIKAQLVITNILGGQSYSTTVTGNSGTVNTVVLPLQTNMPAGTYVVRIVGDKWVSKTIKIIKAN